MSRLPEGEPPLSANFDEDYLSRAVLESKEFELLDIEVEQLRRRDEKFGQSCLKARKAFEAFCGRNNLTNFHLTDQDKMLVLAADVGGNLHPIICLEVLPDMDEHGFLLSTAVKVTVKVGADDGERFTKTKQTSKFQVDEDSLGNVGRKVAPRLRKALRIARTITEADLTESRPLPPATL